MNIEITPLTTLAAGAGAAAIAAVKVLIQKVAGPTAEQMGLDGRARQHPPFPNLHDRRDLCIAHAARHPGAADGIRPLPQGCFRGWCAIGQSWLGAPVTCDFCGAHSRLDGPGGG